MSQLGRISGQLLKDNLTRNGHDLTFDIDLLHLDVTNRKIGIKKTNFENGVWIYLLRADGAFMRSAAAAAA